MTDVPEHLLRRSAERRAALGKGGPAGGGADAGGDGGGGDGGGGGGAGPGDQGPAQRLLTVVKAGSSQDVRPTPADKVHVWPHLLVGEFVAALLMTAFLLVFSTV